MYQQPSIAEIKDTLSHAWKLFKELQPTTAEEHRAQELRSLVYADLRSNLARIKGHPTPHLLFSVANAFHLTLGASHELFGYRLDRLPYYDSQWNGTRTRIIDSYSFNRDLLVQLPLRLADKQMFSKQVFLKDAVREWQQRPIRTLEENLWQLDEIFYVQMGTVDSLGSALPPKAIAMVILVSPEERLHPDPNAIYLLQFGNGYRCNRCFVSGGRLELDISDSRYTGPFAFVVEEEVRIVGRVLAFGLEMPFPMHADFAPVPVSLEPAPLLLPWEHTFLYELLQTKHLRYPRSEEEWNAILAACKATFGEIPSMRTLRRYLSPANSEPHVYTLLLYAVIYGVRYRDILRTLHYLRPDHGRFTLEAIRRARHFDDIAVKPLLPRHPVPESCWQRILDGFTAWPDVLSMRFPEMQMLGDQALRLHEEVHVEGLGPTLRSGSWLLLNRLPVAPTTGESTTRSLCIWRKDSEILVGYVQQAQGNLLFERTDKRSVHDVVPIDLRESKHIKQVTGVIAPLAA